MSAFAPPGTAVRLRPLLGRVLEQLRGSGLPASRLQEIIENMKELRNGMRSQDPAV